MSLEDIMKDITGDNNGTDTNQGGSDDAQANQENNDGTHEGEKKEKTFTQDEVNEIISKRLAKQKDSLMRSIEDGQRSEELDERERKITERELKADAAVKLSEAGLPHSIASLLKYDSKESYEESYKEVTEIFRAAIGEDRKTRARQSTPREGMGGSRGGSDPIRSAFNGKR